MNWNRIGWRTLLKRARDCEKFNKQNMTPNESAFYEPIENVLLYFNDENAVI